MRPFSVSPLLAASGLGLLLALLMPAPVQAVETRLLRDDSFANFAAAETTGIELLATGRLRIAPKVTRLDKSEEAVGWQTVVDPYDGSVFYGTGHNGKVYRHVPGGRTELWADLGEAQALALALDATGGLLIGASPGGKIYRCVQAGKPQLFFDTKEQYIWDLIFDRNGVLYAGTGPNGKIFRIRAQQNGEMYYDSEATNVMGLGFDREGRLLAATQGKATVLRVAAPGQATMLYSSTEDEVRALAADDRGNIYAAINGTRTLTIPDPPQDKPGVAGPGASAINISALIPALGAAPGGAVPGGSSGQALIVQIQPSGFVQNFWLCPEGPIQSLLALPTETSATTARTGTRLLVAAGKKGKVYQVHTADQSFSVLADVDEPMVIGMAAGTGNAAGRLYLTTANKAGLYEVETTNICLGLAESRALNAGTTVRWGALQLEAEVPPGTSLRVETRTGNIAEPSAALWSGWSAATDQMASGTANAAGPGVRTLYSFRSNSPVGQFLQYRVALEATPEAAAAGESPELDSVTAFYVQKNAAPLLRSVNVFKLPSDMGGPGAGGGGGNRAMAAMLAGAAGGGGAIDPQMMAALMGGAGGGGRVPGAGGGISIRPSGGGGGNPAASAVPPPGGPGPDFEARPPGSGIAPAENSKRFLVAWDAADPNGDKLAYKFSIKAEDEQRWKPLPEPVNMPLYPVAGTDYADGFYRVRIEASDAEENAADEATTAVLESQLFQIDNTPPEVTTATAQRVAGTANTWELRVQATDALSLVAGGEYRVGAEPVWHALPPEGALLGNARQGFVARITPEGAPGEEHTISFRVFDSEGNARTSRVVVR